MEHNAAAGVSLTDSQKALLQYLSNLDSLRPGEKRTVGGLCPSSRFLKTVGGITAVMEDDSVRLFSLGSPTRGIPYKEWEIPLPAVDILDGYCFYPGADVIAFLNVPSSVCVV